jgi:microcystin-dependent protein
MSQPFLGQLMLASWNFAPKGYATCNGQLLQINQNQALFSLLGTTYGGDGRTTFALPNLQGRTPIGYGAGFNLGLVGGEDAHTLTQKEVPSHIHNLQGTSGAANTPDPTPSMLAVTTGNAKLYGGASSLSPMNSAIVASAGGSLPHENRQPLLVMTWCIALSGIFPSQN